MFTVRFIATPIGWRGSREGITEMVAENTTDPVPDPLFVPMAGGHGVRTAEFGFCRSCHVFEAKAMVMRSIPKFMRGVFQGAMKVGFHVITKERAANNFQVESRGWKLLCFSPDCFSKLSRGGLIPKGRLKERVTKFCAGEWILLLGGRFVGNVCPGQVTKMSE